MYMHIHIHVHTHIHLQKSVGEKFPYIIEVKLAQIQVSVITLDVKCNPRDKQIGNTYKIYIKENMKAILKIHHKIS
jgi:hypothetical protein